MLALLLSLTALAVPSLSDAQAKLSAGDAAGALADYRAIAAADPDNAMALYMQGRLLLAAGELDAAVPAFEAALAAGFYASVAGYDLACTHARAGDADAAFAALDAAIAAGFDQVDQAEADPDLASLRALPGWAERADRMRRAQRPCMHDDAYRAFDFWLGTWDVFDASGTRIGRNTVTAEERGCVVTERWEGRLGGTGRSLSYLDPADGSWHQDWVSSTGGVVHFTGAVLDGAMDLVGTRAGPGNPTATPTRCVWTPLDDGAVTQAFFARGDDGWTQTSVLTYRPTTP